jgi:CheY-like chemotaxis protein
MTTWGSVPRLDGVRVLVVEDKALVREVVVDALEQCGAEVQAAGSALEGLELLQAQKPDACLTSLAMPGNDGYWLIQQIRSLPPDRGRATPAAAFTGRSTEQDRLEALEAGFQVHIPKPVDLPALIEVVAQLALRASADRGTRLSPADPPGIPTPD